MIKSREDATKRKSVLSRNSINMLVMHKVHDPIHTYIIL